MSGSARRPSSILDAATDESALTMRALAGALDVQAPSLYAHITGIDDVLALVHERINASIDLSRPRRRRIRSTGCGSSPTTTGTATGGTWSPRRSSSPARSTPTTPSVVYEPIAACLDTCGVPIERVMPCMAMLDNVVLGSAIEPFAAAFVGRSSTYRRTYPSLAEALRNSRRRHIDDEGFELGPRRLHRAWSGGCPGAPRDRWATSTIVAGCAQPT